MHDWSNNEIMEVFLDDQFYCKDKWLLEKRSRDYLYILITTLLQDIMKNLIFIWSWDNIRLKHHVTIVHEIERVILSHDAKFYMLKRDPIPML